MIRLVAANVCLVLLKHLGSSLEKILQAESKKRQQQQQRAGGGQLLEMLRRASLFSDGPSGQSSPLRPTAKDFFCEPKYPSPLSKSSEKVDRRSDNEYFLSTKEMFSLPQLHRLKKLGSGTFSDVFLVQHTLTSKFYALKGAFCCSLTSANLISACIGSTEQEGRGTETTGRMLVF